MYKPIIELTGLPQYWSNVTLNHRWSSPMPLPTRSTFALTSLLSGHPGRGFVCRARLALPGFHGSVTQVSAPAVNDTPAATYIAAFTLDCPAVQFSVPCTY